MSGGSRRRVFVCGFENSEEMLDRTRRALGGVDVCGWAARGKSAAFIRSLEVSHWQIPLPDRGSPEAVATAINADRLRFSAIEEENLHYLLERDYRASNHLHATYLLYRVVAHAVNALQTTAPNVVVFCDVPHNAFSYALYLAAQAAGIATRIVKYGPAPHLFWFVDSLDGGGDLLVSESAVTDAIGAELSPVSAEYLARLSGSYQDAMPQYTQAHRSLGSWAGRARAMLERPGRLLRGRPVAKAVNMAKRDRLRRVYESLATRSIDDSTPSVGVFLHLQPERSTMPEGRAFAQQWLLVHQIVAALPEGWRVYVREHPSTFLPGPKLVRGRWLYDALLQLPNVELVSLELEPFELIDAVRCVATVTGTVGIEAVARRTPALVFGNASYNGCEGTYRVHDAVSCRRAFDSIDSGTTVAPERVRAYLAAMERSPRAIQTTYRLGEDLVAFWNSGIAHAELLKLMAGGELSC